MSFILGFSRFFKGFQLRKGCLRVLGSGKGGVLGFRFQFSMDLFFLQNGFEKRLQSFKDTGQGLSEEFLVQVQW